MRGSAALALVALVSHLGCGGKPWEPPPGPLAVRFQAVLDHLRAEHNFPGAVAAYALADGAVATFASGLADREAGVPMAASARMPAGSVGKTFVAAVALELVKEGKLSLDAKVDGWLADRAWLGRLPNAHEITLRHLLTHSSGLRDHYQDPDLDAVIAAGRAVGDPDWHITPDQAIELIANDPPLFPPGGGFAYTDTGYLIVGLVIEKAAGGSYYDELSRRFLDPLKLTLTSRADRRALQGLVPGYIGKENPLGLPRKTAEAGILLFSPASEWTGGGLVSNPSDLVRWAKELYQGRAMPYDYLDDVLTSVAWGDNKDLRYGLGIMISQTALGIRWGHSGWFPGYVSDVRYYPAQRVAVAVQVNSDDDKASGVWLTELAKVVLAETVQTPAASR